MDFGRFRPASLSERNCFGTQLITIAWYECCCIQPPGCRWEARSHVAGLGLWPDVGGQGDAWNAKRQGRSDQALRALLYGFELVSSTGMGARLRIRLGDLGTLQGRLQTP